MHRLALIYILILLYYSDVNAQPFIDILNVNYQHFNSVRYIDDKNSKADNDVFNAALLIPLKLKNDNYILIGSKYSYTKFEARGSQTITSQLYSFSQQIGYDFKWKNQKFSSLVMFIPKFNADEFKLSSQYFQPGGAAIITWKKSEHLSLKAGLYYNLEFFGNHFIPLAGIWWQPSEKINFYGLFPSNLTVEYRVTSKLCGGVSYASYISTFRLREFTNEYFVRQGKKPQGDVQLKLFVNWYLKKRIVLFIETGITHGRYFTIYKNKSEELPDKNTLYRKTEDGIFVSAGVAYRIRFN
jgi:hypothetical protein